MPGVNQPSHSIESILDRSSRHAKVLHENVETFLEHSEYLPPVRDATGNTHSARDYLQNCLRTLKKPEAVLHDLSKLNVGALKSIFDLVVLDIADKLSPALEKICSVAENFEEFFYKYVDPSARGKRNPHSIVTEGLLDLRRSVREILSRKDMHSAAYYSLSSSSSLQLCPGSIKLINGKDVGTLKPVDSNTKDLLSLKNQDLFRQGKGYFMWWKCTHCSFISEYFIRDSATSTLQLSTKTESPTGISDMTYREILWPKSHLPCDRQPHKYDKNHPVLGCTICVAEGKELKRKTNVFRTRKELVEHIRDRHFYSLPAHLIQQRLKIVVDEAKPEKGSYDLHFRRPDVEVVDGAVPRAGWS